MRALVFYRVLAGVEHRRIFLADLGTVVDIGANRGQFALAVRRWAFKARIIAFEPLAEAADTFRKVFQGDSGVILHQAAIGPEAGETTIHVAAAEDSSSLFPITTLQDRLFPGTREIRTEIVKVCRLPDLIASKEIVSPAMLKLDVQGYELEALRGCEELLERFKYVYAECSFMELYSGQALVHDIVHWLGERGWCLRGVYNMIYDCRGKSVQADFLFENSF
jgi:FkbM family methyltransferase